MNEINNNNKKHVAGYVNASSFHLQFLSLQVLLIAVDTSINEHLFIFHQSDDNIY